MRKNIVFMMLAVAVGGLVLTSSTSAQTGSAQTTLSALIAQLQALQAQLNTLKAQQNEVQEQKSQTLARLVSTLKLGASSDDVKTLQALLAADPDIYPEGKITGYYGALTAKAVKKFQKKHGLDQVGNVGPKTLAKLNLLLADNPIGFESSTTPGESSRPCAIVPPGHLIAKGWLKKNAAPVIPTCQTLPPGIAKKLPGNATTTPPAPPPPPPPPAASSTLDVTAPLVSFIQPSGSGVLALNGVVALSATASDNVAVTKVRYYCDGNQIGESPTVPYGVLFDTTTCGQGVKTLYAKAYDAAGNVGQDSKTISLGSDAVLKTLPAPGGDIWGLTWDGNNLWTGTPNGYIYRMNTTGTLMNTLYVNTFNKGLAWDGANLWAAYSNHVVKYNTDGVELKNFEYPAASNQITGMAWDGGNVWMIDRAAKTVNRIDATNGTVLETITVPGNYALLDGLDHRDSHFWLVDAQTNTLIKLNHSGVIVQTYNLPGTTNVEVAFEGDYPWIADVDANVIRKIDLSKLVTPTSTATTTTSVLTVTSVSALATTSSANISWTTNATSTSKVYYSTTNPINLSSASFVYDGSFVSSHSMALSGLSASTTYYYVVESVDAASNKATSTQQSFTTPAVPDTTAPGISAIGTSGIGSSTATVAWTTDEAANSKVSYAVSSPVNTATAPFVSDVAFLTGHSLNLSGLAASSTYYFVITSQDALFNTAASSEQTFTTLP